MSEQAQTGESGGGSSWWKWLVGCGCLAALMVVCTGGAGIAYSGYLASQVYQTAREGIEVRAEVVEKRQKLVEGENVEVNLEKPLEGEDYEAFVATLETWRSTEPFKEIESLAETEETQGEPSLMQQLSVMYKLWKSAAALQKLGGEYIAAIEEHGGIDTHYQRLLRIGAVIAAAH